MFAMKLPDDVRQFLARRFQGKHREWLIGEAGKCQWPLEVPLGIPTEQVALRQVDGVRAWVSAWQRWQGVGTLSWRERRWRTLGVQRLPEKLTLNGPKDQHSSTELPLFKSTEQKLYQSITGNACGQQVRLEQERIRWDVAWNAIQASIR